MRQRADKLEFRLDQLTQSDNGHDDGLMTERLAVLSSGENNQLPDKKEDTQKSLQESFEETAHGSADINPAFARPNGSGTKTHIPSGGVKFFFL